jgi:hypothetical protein
MANYFDNTPTSTCSATPSPRSSPRPARSSARSWSATTTTRPSPSSRRPGSAARRERRLSQLRQFALQEANKYNSAPDTVVPRAEAYLDFLHGASNKPPVENPVEYEGTIRDKGSPDLHDPRKLVEDRSIFEAGYEAGQKLASPATERGVDVIRGYNNAIDDVLALKRSNGLRGRDSVTVREVEAAVQSLRKG